MESAIQQPVPSVGLMQIRSNAVLRQEAEARATAAAPPSVAIDRLSGYIETCWSKAKRAKDPIEQQMLQNLRQRHGVYEPMKLAKIREMGGSEVFMLLTSTKCRAAEAWIEDILRPVAEQPWRIDPTPIPDLPPEVMESVTQDVLAVQNEVLAQAAAAHEMIPSAELAREIRAYAEQRKDVVLKEVQAEAAKRADRMSAKIADQLAEGGWHDAFWAVISDLVTLKAGVLKGPVLRSRKVKRWAMVEGRWKPQLTQALVPEFERVSPFDIYPAPGARTVNDDYLIQRMTLFRADLVAMLGVPGFSDEKIRQALAEYGAGGVREELPVDAARRTIELGKQDTSDLTSIEALQFWGSVPGLYLIDWGMEGDIDPTLEYEIDAWKVGRHVVRAVLNPDKLGRKPYNIGGYEKVPGSFWFKGAPELMADLQDMCNSTARALSNNAMLASGPMVEVDLERMTDGVTDLHPWKIFESTNRQMNESPAVRYYQPTLIVDGLLKAFEFFMTMAEDQTGIPRWSHGNANLGGAGGTSSGLSMLMTAATRGMKKVVGHIDEIVSGAIERLYDYNMLYDEDDSIKGDCTIVARGTSALVEKEQKTMRRTEFLAATGNPIDVQLVGLKNRARMIMQQAKDLGLEVEEPEELQMMIAAVAQQLQAQAMRAGGSQPAGAPAQPPGSRPPAAAPRQIDNAGNPAGGTDDATQMNRPGITPGGG
ncbi:MAG: hypothetical protein P1P84_02710 [Deferrisomatales bacterium]|nr:hypothetical protein [Deferrisomatales bacterium]